EAERIVGLVAEVLEGIFIRIETAETARMVADPDKAFTVLRQRPDHTVPTVLRIGVIKITGEFSGFAKKTIEAAPGANPHAPLTVFQNEAAIVDAETIG